MNTIGYIFYSRVPEVEACMAGTLIMDNKSQATGARVPNGGAGPHWSTEVENLSLSFELCISYPVNNV